MTAPDFLVIGHAAKDLFEGGWRLGGTVAHAGVQAQRLGLRTAVVTRAGDELDLERALAGIEVRRVRSETTTTFENLYERGGRVQYAWEQAPPIGGEHVPPEWRSAKMVLLGPVLGEVPLGIARLFRGSFVGLSPQGWLRDVRPDGLVVRRPWKREASLKGARLVVVSDEEVEGEEPLSHWLREVPVVVVTEGKRGAGIHSEGRWRRIAAFPVGTSNPTGAGDVFAAAFMVVLDEGGDLGYAARFASAAAALSIREPGLEAIAGREEIERLLEEHPEITLQ